MRPSQTDLDTLQRGVHPYPGRPFVPNRPIFVADPIVGAIARKVNAIGKTSTVILPIGTPKSVLTCSAVESPAKAQGRTFSEISVSFTRDTTDKYFAGVNIWAKGYKGNANWELLSSGGDSPVSFLEETTKETLTIAVQAVGSGFVSPLAKAPTCTVTLNGVISAPPAPNVSSPLAATPLGYQFQFDQIVLSAGTQDVIDAYKVYRFTSNTPSSATLVHTFRADPTAAGSIVFQDRTGGNQVFYYWVTAVNTIGLESLKTAAQSSATTSGSADLTLDVKDGANHCRATIISGGNNLAQNGNMANSSVIPPDGWVFSRNAADYAFMSIVTPQVGAGAPSGNAVQMINNPNAVAGLKSIQKFHVIPGETYKLTGSVCIMTGSGGSNQGELYFVGYDVNGTAQQNICFQSLSSLGWNAVSVEGTVLAGHGITYAQLVMDCVFASTSNKGVQFSDIMVRRAPSLSEVTSGTLRDGSGIDGGAF